MADSGDPHRLVTCPYEKAHQIEQYKFHVHLQRCRRQHPKCKKVQCPFDSTHIVNDMDLDFHVSECPKRQLLDSQIYVTDNEYRPIVEVQRTTMVKCEENWETDCVATTYVPDPSRKGNHIITKIQGATPSERRKARMEGVIRYKPKE